MISPATVVPYQLHVASAVTVPVFEMAYEPGPPVKLLLCAMIVVLSVTSYPQAIPRSLLVKKLLAMVAFVLGAKKVVARSPAEPDPSTEAIPEQLLIVFPVIVAWAPPSTSTP